VFIEDHPTATTMKITAHTLVSSVIASSLAAYTVISFLSEGLPAPGAVLGFSFLAVYGLCEMAFIEYVPLGYVRSARRPAATTARKRAEVIVGFTAPAHARRAA
jgi:hypothetical protein